MKIFQLAHSFLPFTRAGTEIYTWRLGKALSAEHAVHILFRVNDPAQPEYAVQEGERDGMRTYALNHTLRQLRSFEETYHHPEIDRIFGGLLERIKPDIVHIQHLLFLSAGMIEEAKKRGIPVVITLHDYWLMCGQGQLFRRDFFSCDMPEAPLCVSCLESQLCIKQGVMGWYQFLRQVIPVFLLQAIKRGYLDRAKRGGFDVAALKRKVMERQEYIQEVLKSVDLFLSPSAYVRQKFIAFGLSPEKIQRYAQPIDQVLFQGIRRRQSDTVRFGFIGVLLPMKGVHVLIEAFRNLQADNAELLIYGKMRAYAGYEGYLRELKERAKGDARIRFMGEFAPEKVGEVFAGLDVLVVPSLWQENAPLVIQEAHAAGIPVIASRTGGITEALLDEEKELFFTPGDASGLRRCMEAFFVFRVPSEKSWLNNLAIENIYDHAQHMASAYQKVIGNREHPSVAGAAHDLE